MDTDVVIIGAGVIGLGISSEFPNEYQKSLDAYNNYLALAPKEAPDRDTVLEAVNQDIKSSCFYEWNNSG